MRNLIIFSLTIFFTLYLAILFPWTVLADNGLCPMEMDAIIRDKSFVRLEKYPEIFFSPNVHVQCSYYDNGNLELEKPYLLKGEEIRSNGLVRKFRKNGYRWYEEPYKDNARDGIFKYYDSNNRLAYEMTYKDDSPNFDSIKRYYIPGFVREVEKKCPKDVSYMVAETEKGYGKLIKEGFSSTTFTKDGYECEYDTYYNDLEDDLTINSQWFKDRKNYKWGSLVRQSQLDENGKMNGETRKYFDGNLTYLANFVNGKINGNAKKFFEDSGKIREEISYDNGKVTIGRFYRPNGKLIYEAEVQDEKIVRSKKYRENGEIMASTEFKDGEPLKGLCYKKDKTTRELSESEIEILNKINPLKKQIFSNDIDCDD